MKFAFSNISVILIARTIPKYNDVIREGVSGYPENGIALNNIEATYSFKTSDSLELIREYYMNYFAKNGWKLVYQTPELDRGALLYSKSFGESYYEAALYTSAYRPPDFNLGEINIFNRNAPVSSVEGVEIIR